MCNAIIYTGQEEQVISVLLQVLSGTPLTGEQGCVVIVLSSRFYNVSGGHGSRLAEVKSRPHVNGSLEAYHVEQRSTRAMPIEVFILLQGLPVGLPRTRNL